MPLEYIKKIKRMQPKRVTHLLPLFILLVTTSSGTVCSAFFQHLPQLINAVNEARTYYAEKNGNISSVTAVSDCRKLYDDSALRLIRLSKDGGVTIGNDDARAWVTGVLDNHRSCLYELEDEREGHGGLGGFAGKLNASIINSLAWFSQRGSMFEGDSHEVSETEYNGILELWKPETSKAEFVVAKDGSGSHHTINQALYDLAKRGNNRPRRVIVYVKSGKYHENVEIPRFMRDVMFVGDGMDRTIVTGNRNVVDGSTTYSSATFGVSGDGFWARDMTFENTAGPQKHQAVALRVNSDRSIFYRCSFKAYQDTLFTHSLRQFYRDCQIHGTIDFIFGNAAAVIQNCDIIIWRPMNHQSNMVTAQGRGTVYENTGISIQGSRILPSPELKLVKGSFRTYLGRPWKEYSRTVVWKSDLDGVVDQRGWCEWRGGFALSTLYYAEYMNTGSGASTNRRVKWPGYHVLARPRDVAPFTVSRFIQGQRWIPASGVPVSVFM